MLPVDADEIVLISRRIRTTVQICREGESQIVYGNSRSRPTWYDLNKLRSVAVGRAIVIMEGRTMSRSRVVGSSRDRGSAIYQGKH
jgi:hypothetical protein